jgi:hypothetical protein
MEAAVECTHCGVVMTSWAARGSPIRYYQCPFCSRTHSSQYGEVFRRRAGARVLDAALAPPPSDLRAGIPTASPEDVRWNRVKASAARWFDRLEADERRHGPVVAARKPATRVTSAAKPVAPAAKLSTGSQASPSKPSAPAKPTPAAARRVAGADVPEADPLDVVELRPAVHARKP